MAASEGAFDLYAEFSVAISTACALLNVEHFYPDLEEALCNFLKVRNLFLVLTLVMRSRSFSTPYQSLPMF